MIERMHKARSSRALLISLVIHLCLLIAWTIVIYRQQDENSPDAVAVEFVNEQDLPKPRRKLLKPQPRLFASQQVRSPVPDHPQTVKLQASQHPINETLKLSERLLRHSAADNQRNPQDKLPDVMTATQQLDSREVRIPTVSTITLPEDGKGVKSFRQRVHGNGSGGLNMFESTGTADVGAIGNRSGAGGATPDENPFADALRRIADHIILTRQNDKVNVVFVLDTSASMRDNIQQVADHLYTMTDAYTDINLEYYLGMLEFSVKHGGQSVKTKPLMPDAAMLRHRMKNVQLSGDEHALDALMATLSYIQFHSDADKHLVLVTDEPATTSMRKAGAIKEMREKVLDNYTSQDIHINVLGHADAFQQRLAKATDGLWQEIPGGAAKPGNLLAAHHSNDRSVRENVKLQKLLRNVRKIVREIVRGGHDSNPEVHVQSSQQSGGDFPASQDARHFPANDIETAPAGISRIRAAPKFNHANVDIIIMLDYSRSMSGKSEAIMFGISEFFGKLEIAPIDYRIGLIRFAEAKDAIKSIDGTVVTHMPISEGLIKRLSNLPFGGDEHFIDAIVEGLPQFRFRSDARRALLAFTDEPSTGSYPPEHAIEVCQALGIRAYVIGAIGDGSNFQSTLAQKTNGLALPMPDSFSKPYPNQ